MLFCHLFPPPTPAVCPGHPSCGFTSQTSCLRCVPGWPGPCVCFTIFPSVPRSPADGDRSISSCFAYKHPYSKHLQACVSVFHLYYRCCLSMIQISPIPRAGDTMYRKDLVFALRMLWWDRTGNRVVSFCFYFEWTYILSSHMNIYPVNTWSIVPRESLSLGSKGRTELERSLVMESGRLLWAGDGG